MSIEWGGREGGQNRRDGQMLALARTETEREIGLKRLYPPQTEDTEDVP